MESTTQNPNPTPTPPSSDHRIKLNVGGTHFETTRSTLLPTTLSSTTTSSLFIDRDPVTFPLLLSLLRSHRLPSSFSKHHLLADDAAFFGIENLVIDYCLSTRHPFTGIDASKIKTLTPPVDPIISTFSVEPVSGSLLISHGGLISTYDVTLRNRTCFRTHLDLISSIKEISKEIFAFGSEAAAGLHFYGTERGDHVGSVHWTDETDPRIYKSRVTAIGDSNEFVYASFDCRHVENVILIIDKSTLKIGTEISRQKGNAAKTVAPRKLRFVPKLGVLVGSAVTSGAFGYAGYVRVWDPRSGGIVWETSEPGSGRRSARFGDAMCDVDVDVEEGVIAKVCSKSGDVGVVEMRMLGEDTDPWVYLEDPNPGLKVSTSSDGDGIVCCYAKQVFVGREKGLEVWSRRSGGEGGYRRNYVDKVEDAERGVITRIEGGGNRLFLARENVEGVEVWESSDFSGVVPGYEAFVYAPFC